MVPINPSSWGGVLNSIAGSSYEMAREGLVNIGLRILDPGEPSIASEIELVGRGEADRHAIDESINIIHNLCLNLRTKLEIPKTLNELLDTREGQRFLRNLIRRFLSMQIAEGNLEFETTAQLLAGVASRVVKQITDKFHEIRITPYDFYLSEIDEKIGEHDFETAARNIETLLERFARVSGSRLGDSDVVEALKNMKKLKYQLDLYFLAEGNYKGIPLEDLRECIRENLEKKKDKLARNEMYVIADGLYESLVGSLIEGTDRNWVFQKVFHAVHHFYNAMSGEIKQIFMLKICQYFLYVQEFDRLAKEMEPEEREYAFLNPLIEYGKGKFREKVEASVPEEDFPIVNDALNQLMVEFLKPDEGILRNFKAIIFGLIVNIDGEDVEGSAEKFSEYMIRLLLDAFDNETSAEEIINHFFDEKLGDAISPECSAFLRRKLLEYFSDYLEKQLTAFKADHTNCLLVQDDTKSPIREIIHSFPPRLAMLVSWVNPLFQIDRFFDEQVDQFSQIFEDEPLIKGALQSGNPFAKWFIKSSARVALKKILDKHESFEEAFEHYLSKVSDIYSRFEEPRTSNELLNLFFPEEIFPETIRQNGLVEKVRSILLKPITKFNTMVQEHELLAVVQEALPLAAEKQLDDLVMDLERFLTSIQTVEINEHFSVEDHEKVQSLIDQGYARLKDRVFSHTFIAEILAQEGKEYFEILLKKYVEHHLSIMLQKAKGDDVEEKFTSLANDLIEVLQKGTIEERAIELRKILFPEELIPSPAIRVILEAKFEKDLKGFLQKFETPAKNLPHILSDKLMIKKSLFAASQLIRDFITGELQPPLHVKRLSNDEFIEYLIDQMNEKVGGDEELKELLTGHKEKLSALLQNLVDAKKIILTFLEVDMNDGDDLDLLLKNEVVKFVHQSIQEGLLEWGYMGWVLSFVLWLVTPVLDWRIRVMTQQVLDVSTSDPAKFKDFIRVLLLRLVDLMDKTSYEEIKVDENELPNVVDHVGFSRIESFVVKKVVRRFVVSVPEQSALQYVIESRSDFFNFAEA